MDKIIIPQYIVWHFFEAPKAIISAWQNFLVFGINYFSIPTLVATFFSHFHKYYYPYGNKWDMGRWIEALVFNFISRVFGAILRATFIVMGVIFEALIFIFGVLALFVWIFLPVILISGLIIGAGILF